MGMALYPADNGNLIAAMTHTGAGLQLMHDELMDYVEHHGGQVRLDLRFVKSIDNATIGLFKAAAARLEETGGGLQLQNVNAELFYTHGLYRIVANPPAPSPTVKVLSGLCVRNEPA